MPTEKQKANLIKAENLTSSQLRERASKGGKASARKRKELKTFKELDALFTSDNDRLEMLEMLIKKAKHGNTKAFEIYRDTMGMKPTDTVKVESVDPGLIDDMQRYMDDMD